MNNTINVEVREREAFQTNETAYICGNSDFVINFVFDSEWDEINAKTARFICNGETIDVVFKGNECTVPTFSNAFGFRVGIYAGNLQTTIPAYVEAKKAVLCESGFPSPPPEDVYNQIMELLNRVSGAKPATDKALGTVIVGDNLQITEAGVLSAVTINKAEQGNTKPITSAAVYEQLGNIEALLAAL